MFSSSVALYQVKMKGDVNGTSFSLTVISSKLYVLGHANSQLVSILTFKQIYAGEKIHVVLASRNKSLKEWDEFLEK